MRKRQKGERKMIVTTTGSIEGRKITGYKGIVFGEVILGVDFVKGIDAGIRNFFGGRSQAYEQEIIAARQKAINEMCQNAFNMGANAVIGVKIDYEQITGMLMVTASGTAVVV
jgi:uncharacterized protein YbjQ (UPF0145 family)